MVYTTVLFSIFIIAFLRFTRNTAKKKDRMFMVLTFLVLWGLSAVRYQEGYSDFRGNYMAMITIRDSTFKELISNKEFLHDFLRKAISMLSDDPQTYFFVSSFFITYIVFRFGYKYANYTVLYVLLYYCAFSYFTFNNITRQGIAVSFMMISYDQFIRRKNISCILTAIIAVLFHSSAILSIVPFFLTKVKVSRRNLSIYFLLLALLLIANKPITDTLINILYTDYAEEGAYGREAANLLYIVFPVLAVIFIYLYLSAVPKSDIKVVVRGKHVRVNDNQISQQRFNGLLVHGTIVYTIFIILSCVNMLLFARLSLYYVPHFMLCIDRTIENMSKANRMKWTLFMVIFCIAFFAVMNASGKLIPTPFHAFWEFENRPK